MGMAMSWWGVLLFYMFDCGDTPHFQWWVVGGGCKLRDGYWLGWFGYAAT